MYGPGRAKNRVRRDQSAPPLYGNFEFKGQAAHLACSCVQIGPVVVRNTRNFTSRKQQLWRQ